MANTPVRTFRVDEYTWNKIQRIAEKEKTSVSSVVLAIIKNHLEEKDK
jgi:predicted DNA-binding ribbon-helix-helix protein